MKLRNRVVPYSDSRKPSLSGLRKNKRRTKFLDSLHVRNAVASGNLEQVRQFLEQGLSPNEVDGNGWTLVHLAASKGREKVLRMLLECGGQIDVKDLIGGFTPLHYAAMHGRTRVAKLIVDECKSNLDQVINVRSCDGWTPLHVAAHYGRCSFGHLLLQHQARIDSLSEKGTTPLQLSLIRERISCIRVLLEWQANINVQLGFPLRYAVIKSNYKIARILLERGADMNLRRQDDGQSPLHLAALKDDALSCQMLYQFGANCNMRNDDNMVPLEIAKSLSTTSRPCLDFLTEITSNPRSLQDMCRLVIRRIMGPARLDQINKLPLSKFMLNYLKHKFD